MVLYPTPQIPGSTGQKQSYLRYFVIPKLGQGAPVWSMSGRRTHLKVFPRQQWSFDCLSPFLHFHIVVKWSSMYGCPKSQSEGSCSLARFNGTWDVSTSTPCSCTCPVHFTDVICPSCRAYASVQGQPGLTMPSLVSLVSGNARTCNFNEVLQYVYSLIEVAYNFIWAIM